MNSKNPTISVIIPAYNNSGTIVRAVKSVLAQTFEEYELIVIDDGSTDDTRTVLSEFITEEKILYRYQNNKGCAGARNAGIRMARGKYVAFLDADDCWHEEKLKSQIKVFLENPTCIVCYTEVYVIKNGVAHTVNRTSRTKQRSGRVLPYLIFHNIVTLSSALVQIDILRKVGGFNEDRNIMYVEDYDLWLTIAPLGDFCPLAEPLASYTMSDTPTEKEKRVSYAKILRVFAHRFQVAPLYLKPLYMLGWITWAIQYIRFPFSILRKLGLKKTITEIKRRFLISVDFLFYPLLERRIQSRTFDSVVDLLNFSYRESFGLLVPGQIESEIRTFLGILKEKKLKNVLEIGTAHGGNLFLLTKVASPNSKIISLDLPRGDFGGGYFARKQRVYKAFASGAQKMYLLRGDSHAKVSQQDVKDILGNEKLGVLFIDGDHTYQGVKSDFEMYSPFVEKGGIIAFHDIGNSPAPNYGVEKFWSDIKNRYAHQEIIASRNQMGYGIGVLFLE